MSDLDLTTEEVAFLRTQFEAWKDEHIPPGVRLVDHPLFREGLRSLVEDHGYGMKTIGAMLGVSKQRVSQWAAAACITRPGHGSLNRIFDNRTNQFVPVDSKAAYLRRQTQISGPRALGKKLMRKRRRVANWVLVDLGEDLGRTPGLSDLADAYDAHPGKMQSVLGMTARHGNVSTQWDNFWVGSGFTRPKYNEGGRGRPDRKHRRASGGRKA